jgi:hypothetical protein
MFMIENAVDDSYFVALRFCHPWAFKNVWTEGLLRSNGGMYSFTNVYTYHPSHVLLFTHVSSSLSSSSKYQEVRTRAHHGDVGLIGSRLEAFFKLLESRMTAWDAIVAVAHDVFQRVKS